MQQEVTALGERKEPTEVLHRPEWFDSPNHGWFNLNRQ
jgi:hypothetical protein